MFVKDEAVWVPLSHNPLQRETERVFAAKSQALAQSGYPDAIRVIDQDDTTLVFEYMPITLDLFVRDAKVRSHIKVSSVHLFRRIVAALGELSCVHGGLNFLDRILMTPDGSRLGFIKPEYIPDWETWRKSTEADVRSMISAWKPLTHDASFQEMLIALEKADLSSTHLQAEVESMIVMRFGMQ